MPAGQIRAQFARVVSLRGLSCRVGCGIAGTVQRGLAVPMLRVGRRGYEPRSAQPLILSRDAVGSSRTRTTRSGCGRDRSARSDSEVSSPSGSGFDFRQVLAYKENCEQAHPPNPYRPALWMLSHPACPPSGIGDAGR